MIDVWKCTKCGRVLELDDELQPEGRLVTKLEGHTCQGNLHIEDVQYLHCRVCEARGKCIICNREPQHAVEYERI